MAGEKDKDKKPAAQKPSGGVFDVSRPGRTPASPTSRPVILGHKPEAAAAQAAVSGIGEASPVLTRRKIQITPLGDLQVVDGQQQEPQKKQESAPAKPLVKDAEGTQVSEKDQEALAVAALDAVTGPPDLSAGEASKLAANPEPEAQSQPEEPKQTEPPAEGEPQAAEEPAPAKTETKPEAAQEQEPAADAETQEPSTPETTEESAPEEPAPTEDQLPNLAESQGQEGQTDTPKPEPYIEPLFDDSGVVVSHHHAHHHRGHGLQVFLLVLLVLVLAAVILDILLDLELLTLPNIPHTDYL